jgi:hypothetical protein
MRQRSLQRGLLNSNGYFFIRRSTDDRHDMGRQQLGKPALEKEVAAAMNRFVVL